MEMSTLSKYDIKEHLLVVSGKGRWGVIKRKMMFMEQYPKLNINLKGNEISTLGIKGNKGVLLWPSLLLLGLY